MFHRSLQNHYTKYVSYIARCTYTHGRLTPTPSQLSIDALTTATPNLADLADIAQCTYMHGKWNPQAIEHRCLEYHYTKLGTSHGRSIYIYIYIYIYKYIYIYIEQGTYSYGRLTTPPPIKHRCLENCYTTLGTSNGRSVYI